MTRYTRTERRKVARARPRDGGLPRVDDRVRQVAEQVTDDKNRAREHHARLDDRVVLRDRRLLLGVVRRLNKLSNEEVEAGVNIIAEPGKQEIAFTRPSTPRVSWCSRPT